MDKKELLLEAAKKCFINNGYRETTIKDISMEAGVSVGTVYSYFKNKRELFDALDMPEAELLQPAHEEKKTEILHAALHMINTHPIEKITMDSIAQSLGYSKAYIYQFFDSKEDLIKQVLQTLSLNEKAVNVFDLPEEQDLEEMIRAIGWNYIQSFEDQERLALAKIMINNAAAYPEYVKVYQDTAIVYPYEMIVSIINEFGNSKDDPEYDERLLRISAESYIRSLYSYILTNNLVADRTDFGDKVEYLQTVSEIFLSFLHAKSFILADSETPASSAEYEE